MGSSKCKLIFVIILSNSSFEQDKLNFRFIGRFNMCHAIITNQYKLSLLLYPLQSMHINFRSI